MADEKPTDGARVVSLDLSIERRLILRSEIEAWLAGDREDLETPDKLGDPDSTRRRVATYERLIEALTRGKIELPDEEACAVLQEAAHASDDAEEWAETKAVHDAQQALLAVFGGDHEGSAPTATDRQIEGGTAWTTRDDDLAMQSAVLQRVLDVHPAELTADELIREIVGDGAEFGHRDAVDRAARDLAGIGLLHLRDEFVTPRRAALRFQELIDR